MKTWLVNIRYRDRDDVEQEWNGEVEAETAEAARIAGERKPQQERHRDYAGTVDAAIEPQEHVAPILRDY
jgi:hypothetical protein